MSKKYYVEGPVADPTVVRLFTRHLLDAYDSFVNNFDGRVDYVEGMMAAHNFHTAVIEHLVEESGDPMWRKAARTTFARRMDNPGEYDTRRGDDHE